MGGTIVCGPVEVATRISRRHRRGLQQRELLSQPASPGDTQDVGLLVAEIMQHLAQEQGQGGETVRQIGQLRAADAGGIEADHLDGRVECIHERPQGFQPHADAVAQQERRPCPGARPDRDAQRRPAHLHDLFAHGVIPDRHVHSSSGTPWLPRL